MSTPIWTPEPPETNMDDLMAACPQGRYLRNVGQGIAPQPDTYLEKGPLIQPVTRLTAQVLWSVRQHLGTPYVFTTRAAWIEAGYPLPWDKPPGSGLTPAVPSNAVERMHNAESALAQVLMGSREHVRLIDRVLAQTSELPLPP